ncbi:MAG TPA: TPM domain-containing protein [Candidatus Tyrphobacter sp.]
MNRLAHARIERAIRSAEAGTTGHIVVRIVPDAQIDAFARARDEFERAGLHAAKERNAAMILVAPIAKKFAVLGDRELHARVGEAFWERVVGEMEPIFAEGKTADAIALAVERIGRELHAHFPARG